MNKIFIKLFILLIIILISIFAGYENPKLVEIPKKYIHMALDDLGFNNNSVDSKKDKDLPKLVNEEKEVSEIIANSFSLEVSKVKSYQDKTASLIVLKNNSKVSLEIFTRSGFFIKEDKVIEMNLPSSFYKEKKKDGGVKSVFTINGKYFALISQKKFSCLYS